MSVDPEIKAQALALYRRGYTVRAIAEKTGINFNTVMYWVDKGSTDHPPWKNLKRINEENQLKGYLEGNKANLKEIYSMGIELVWRSLRDLLQSDEVLSPNAVNTLMNALDKVEKWESARNEREIAEGTVTSVETAREVLKKHAFYTENAEEAAE